MQLQIKFTEEGKNSLHKLHINIQKEVKEYLKKLPSLPLLTVIFGFSATTLPATSTKLLLSAPIQSEHKLPL
jgi:hypothetical protein